MNKSYLTVLFLLYCIVGICLDLMPIIVGDGIDKVYHFIGFFMFTILASIVFSSFNKKHLDYFLGFMLFGGIILAIGAEYMQNCVPIRDCGFYDILFNYLGIAIAITVIYISNLFKEKKKHL